MNLYRNIDRNKLQFDFVVSGDNCYYSDEIKSLGGNIFYITPKRHNVFLNIKDIWLLLKKLKKTYNIVYFNLSALYYNIPFIFTKLFRYSIIIAHGHNTCPKIIKKDLRYYLHCLNRCYVAHASDFLLACSKEAGEWVIGKKAVTKGKVHIIPNAIYTENFKYNEEVRGLIRDELGIKKEQFVVGHIGRFTYQKNHSFLIDIFREICEINKDAILLLVGDGELRGDIENKILALGLAESVIFTGSRSEVSSLLQAMDAFVLPSLFEGFGIVLVEAQVSGLLCFTSKGDVPEQVNITGNVKFIELDKGPTHWAEQILNYSGGFTRTDMTESVKKAGYDIKDLASKFQKFITSINGSLHKNNKN